MTHMAKLFEDLKTMFHVFFYKLLYGTSGWDLIQNNNNLKY